MTALGTISYAAAAIGFLLLTLLLVASWRGRRSGGHVIVASAMTAVWAAVLAAQSFIGSIPFVLLYLLEIARGCAWLLALCAVASTTAPRWLARAARGLCIVLLAAPILVPLLLPGGSTIDPIVVLSRAGLALSLLSLVLLEQIYRNSSAAARHSFKYLAIGAGVLFAYDLFLYSQTELLRGVMVDAWNARGLLSVLAVPLIAIAARRNPEWSLDVFVSRQVVFHTSTIVAAGVYLMVMALGGYYVRDIGGSWGQVGQIVFLAGAAVVLATLLASASLRRHARVFISKHFYRNKYDYRVEWLRFIATLSSTEVEDVRRTAVHAIAQVFASPGGALFLLDESGRAFVPYAAWPMPVDSILGVASVAADDELASFLKRTQWIIDTREYRRAPDVYGNMRLPAWLQENTDLRIVAPLLQLERLVGFVVLYEPPPPFDLTYEDRDLLKTLGRHVATHIAQQDADRKLAESGQFEAYNRLTAFMMHDLKNSIAQLKLVVANSARHKHNPDFIDDAIGTISNAVDRMTRLIEQLRGAPAADRVARVDLGAAAREALQRCTARQPQAVLDSALEVMVQADPERLATVIEHIVRNAQDATPEGGTVRISVGQQNGEALLVVEDTGSGMVPEFVRDRLFRPFDSTKGAKGMGIGAYQAREYVRQLGGSVEVQSSPGKGTRFAIRLPLSAEPAVRAVIAETG